MGYRLNRLDEPVFIAVSKHLLTEFGIHLRLESCGEFSSFFWKGDWQLYCLDPDLTQAKVAGVAAPRIRLG